MTTKEDVIKALKDFFGDTSRPAAETKEGLEEIIDEAEMLASTIPDESPLAREMRHRGQ